ncbi:MAG: tRNA (uridine(34)/cytosine(34)/5-carboxymethylaminomethyluridine(34)-2'-O)-methyltransferase TrmL [Ruminococcaceae bacterium]|nr:tRNA (uridine(34)/cytosine(34)/5-carboxymethylaminomethyluridine(34)-2'-O)-methyltransferase TrmL [Oscillospiraceae bacterium]
MFLFNIVLVEPEIPQNTGNIARTCAATGCKLHIVKPMGFEIDDKKLKRAGLDYWHLLGIQYYENLDDFYDKNKGGRFFYSTTKAVNTYADAEFKDGDYILFGKETKGLPEELLYNNKEWCIRIPMIDEARSLNLSNAVAIVAYEALRQTDFKQLKQAGELTKFNW